MFQLKKTNTVEHDCRIRQLTEDGSVIEGTLRVRYKVLTRDALEAMSQADDSDERLLFDEVVTAIVTPVAGDDGALSAEDAFAVIRNDLAVSAQVVAQYWDVLNGAAAKNAKRSRGR